MKATLLLERYALAHFNFFTRMPKQLCQKGYSIKAEEHTTEIHSLSMNIKDSSNQEDGKIDEKNQTKFPLTNKNIPINENPKFVSPLIQFFENGLALPPWDREKKPTFGIYLTFFFF